jgi:hypothetical protein
MNQSRVVPDATTIVPYRYFKRVFHTIVSNLRFVPSLARWHASPCTAANRAGHTLAPYPCSIQKAKHKEFTKRVLSNSSNEIRTHYQVNLVSNTEKILQLFQVDLGGTTQWENTHLLQRWPWYKETHTNIHQAGLGKQIQIQACYEVISTNKRRTYEHSIKSILRTQNINILPSSSWLNTY